MTAGDGTSLGGIVVAKGDAITCTITNSRNKGSIELKKIWSGTGGQTTLNIGTSAGGSQTDSQQTGAAGAGPLTTGANDVNTGTYYVSESGGLTDYSSSLACTKNGDAYVPGANDSVVVGKGDTVVCTFTNTRNQGSIKVIKDFVGAPADAKVNLQIDGVTKKANALDNDTTGFIPVDTGTHSVGETQVTGTNLSDYTSSIVCKLGTTTVASGDGTSLGDIPVGKGDQVVCTITNTRITGSFKITKVLYVGGSGFNTEPSSRSTTPARSGR